MSCSRLGITENYSRYEADPSWANSGSGIVCNNIYRGAVHGGPYQTFVIVLDAWLERHVFNRSKMALLFECRVKYPQICLTPPTLLETPCFVKLTTSVRARFVSSAVS